MPTVPDESTILSNRSGNPTRRKWTRHINREVLHCYYRTRLSCTLSGFKKLMHQLCCEQNPSLTDVSEQRLADQKQYLLTSGKLNESELKEIKCKARTPISGLPSVTPDVCAGVQMSTLDAFSD